MRTSAAALAALLILGQPLVGGADARAESTPETVGYGAGSFLGTLVYTPVKASFCILGGISSAFVFPFGGPDTAGKVARTTCGGTWMITPDTLKGKERVKFVGDTAPAPPAGATRP